MARRMERDLRMNLEKFLIGLLVTGGAALLTAGYFSTNHGVKIAGAIVLIFVWYVAYDIVVNRD